MGLAQGPRMPYLKPLRVVWAELVHEPGLLTPGFVGYFNASQMQQAHEVTGKMLLLLRSYRIGSSSEDTV